jgi:S-adenosylmethionine:tRNA ribosyltransferase-isomerase
VKRSELDYELPSELIAQAPLADRDASRLLVLHRQTGAIEHGEFRDLRRHLPARALLVLNDTKVIPAKFIAQRPTGGRVEGLFLREENAGAWEVLLRGSRLRPGLVLTLGDGAFRLTLEQRRERGAWLATIEPAEPAERILATVGRTPLPPYIRRDDDAGRREDDVRRYQTVYASQPGAVAAPTAGLHFTDSVFASLAERGIGCVRLTLHVGQGTFAPIEAESLDEHRMHAEWYELSPDAAERINAARAGGRTIVAVGTTAGRVLESCADQAGRVHAASGWTDIFLCPPYRFRAVDAMITNFHLPGSTLLAYVFAFGGVEAVRRAYAEAIARRYRFYSYGDAMLVV